MAIFKRNCGIIVEYNPFHYGHKYHIDQAKSITDCDILIAIMSPNVVQRGEFAVIDKRRRVLAALQQGVDVVFELPSIFVLQNADIFATGAIKLLAQSGITDLVFGSESADLAYLNQLAELNFDIDKIKEELRGGDSYPQVLGRLSDKLYPNDILALAYLKALKNYPTVTPHLLKRTNSYLATTLDSEFASATAIRAQLHNQSIDLSVYTPLADDLRRYSNDPSAYYNLIRYQLLVSQRAVLSSYLLVDEGIENHLVKVAQNCEDYATFLQQALTKRYTASRIRRTLMNILLQVKKSDKETLETTSKLRLLGFNRHGRRFLKQLKAQEVPYVSQFRDLAVAQRELELRCSQLYQLYYPDKTIVASEVQGPSFYDG